MHWALLEIETLTDSEPSYPAVCYSLGHGTPHQIIIVSKAFLLQAEAKVSLSYLRLGVAASVHSPLPDSMVLEDVSPSFYPWTPRDSHGIN